MLDAGVTLSLHLGPTLLVTLYNFKLFQEVLFALIAFGRTFNLLWWFRLLDEDDCAEDGRLLEEILLFVQGMPGGEASLKIYLWISLNQVLKQDYENNILLHRVGLDAFKIHQSCGRVELEAERGKRPPSVVGIAVYEE